METTAVNKTLKSPMQAFEVMHQAFRALPYLVRKSKYVQLGDVLKERVMLAVTEVNGCAMCAFGHTQMALEAGMSNSEIAQLLQGSFDDVPREDLPAILFAQHYADKNGRPTKAAWQRLVEVYGADKAKAVLAAVRMIMAGNTFGIPLGSLIGRIKGDKGAVDSRSHLLYELLMMVVALVSLVGAPVTAAIASLLRRPFAGF